MKKLLVILLVLGCLMGSLVGCNKQNNNNIEGKEVYVTFDGYGLHGGMLEVNMTTETLETGSMDLVSMQGNETIADIMTKNEVVSIGAINEYDTFEGWLIFKTEVYTDVDGFDTVTNTLESNKVYTTDEVLAYTVGNYNITIAAKWAGMDISQYYIEDDMMFDSDTTGAFVFNANDGLIELESTYDKGLMESANYTFWMEDGQSINDLLKQDSWHNFTDVVKTGSTFAGWQLYEGTSVSWSNEKSSVDTDLVFAFDKENVDFKYLILENGKAVDELKTTEDVIHMKNFSKAYYAEAVWK